MTNTVPSTVTAVVVDVLRHATETGGGPTGFGWASFVTFAVGIGVVLYSAGQLMKVLHTRRTHSAENRVARDANDDTVPGASQSQSQSRAS